MALYHTYRPQTFDTITGQEHVVQTLTNQIVQEKVAHAYLFSGPRGVGKTTSARLLAKGVNCRDRKKGDAEPCNTCQSCTEIGQGRAIDVIEIDAASHTGVDNVRENIIDNAQFKPTNSTYKVFIIDEVHMLSKSAFNALLKTLEEPPTHAIFILATTELHKLPETIISRCQRFDFKKVGHEIMGKHLSMIAKKEDTTIESAVIDRIINKSDGCVRDAVSLLDQIMATGEKTITSENASLMLPSTNVESILELVKACVHRQTDSGLSIINQAVRDGAQMGQFAHDTIELLRIMLVTKANNQIETLGLDLSQSVKKELEQLNQHVRARELVTLIDIFLHRRQEIKTAPIAQLPLEMAVIEWCEGEKTQPSTLISDSHTVEPDSKKQEVSDIQSNDKKPSTTKLVKQSIVTNTKKILQKKNLFALEDVERHWPACMQTLEQNSPSLVFILKMATLRRVSGHTLTIEVQYSFHRDKLCDKPCKDKVESALSSLLGEKVDLCVEVTQDAPEKDRQDLQELAAAFGGEVVG